MQDKGVVVRIYCSEHYLSTLTYEESPIIGEVVC